VLDVRKGRKRNHGSSWDRCNRGQAIRLLGLEIVGRILVGQSRGPGRDARTRMPMIEAATLEYSLIMLGRVLLVCRQQRCRSPPGSLL